MRRPCLLLAVACALFALAPFASARAQRRVEVVEVSGIIDSTAEHAVTATIRDANKERAQLVVIQLNSAGAIGADRGTNLLGRVSASRVPVAVWIPSGGAAANSAAVLAIAAHYTSMAPGSRIGPIKTFDLSSRDRGGSSALKQLTRGSARRFPFDRSVGPRTAIRDHISDGIAASVTDVLSQLDGKTLRVAGRSVHLSVDPATTQIRLRKLGLIGGALHAAAKPSIVYLLLLLGIVGIVFELFHPSTGPAGFAGLLSLALGIYGMVTLHGSWGALVVICFGIAAFCIDLATEHLGPLTILGFLALTGGSIFLFPGPYLRVSPFVLAFGVIAMTMFLLGAMTRVLRDLRALARGELEVREAHPHPDGQGG